MSELVASISELLAAMLPETVRFAVGEVAHVEGELLEAEARQAEPYGDKRLGEFRASRILARQLLAQLGHEESAVLSGEQREPLWPEGISGTISHSGGVVIVAMAQRSGTGLGPTVGVDIEMRPALKRDLWDKIFLPGEVEALEAIDSRDAGAKALLQFSAKESFYKAQFPLTETYLAFEGLNLGLCDKAGLISYVVEDEEVSRLLGNRAAELRGASTPEFALSTCVFVD